MALWIDSIYYFDLRKDIGFYDSIRNFTSSELEYIGLAISTPKIHVDSTPLEFFIPYVESNKIRDYVTEHARNLIEISKDTAKKESQYILICCSDGSDHYFTYNEAFCQVFNMALRHKPQEELTDSFGSINFFNNNQPTDYIQQFLCNSPQPTNSSNTYSYPSPQDTRKTFPWKKIFLVILAIFLAICLLAPIFSENKEEDTDLTPITEPRSGYVLTGTEVYGGNTITITAPSKSSCVVKLKTQTGVERLCFFVRAGEKITVGVPKENLYVYFATGKTWYGLKHLFGNTTSFSMDDELIDFAKYSMTYKLTPIEDGNFTQTPIDRDEF